MKRFWKYAAEYAMLEAQDELIQEPVQFGPILLNPGDRIISMGDGRPHRSFAMSEGFTLQYAGYVYVDDGQFLLFTVPEQPKFQQHGVFYSFLFLNPPNRLCLYNGIGSREIILERVQLADRPLAIQPIVIRPVQLSIFDLWPK